MAGKKKKAGTLAKLAPFRCEPLSRGVFVSNDFGGWLALGEAEADSLKSGRYRGNAALCARLEAAGFFPGADPGRAVLAFRELNRHAFRGPSLHILVVTLKCNHACVYCRAPGGAGFQRAVMSAETARKSVDMAFRSPNPDIAIEFQGGEALLNWPVVREAVLYAKKKNLSAGKNLVLSVVTNLTLMDEAKFSFLAREGVGICTSLDGPALLHDANRRWLGGSSAGRAGVWLKKALAASRRGGRPDALPSALMTTTRLSLGHPRKIVDAYRSLGLGGIFLRPLSPIGHAGTVWGEIGYEPEEYAAFYREALGYILEVNRSGERFVERGAALLARKLLAGEDPNFLDQRSPCGAATGQLAYNWDGGVYTCDEGRMAGAGRDDFFRLGSVRDGYAGIVNAPAARACAMASCLESQPYCARCAWKPFCGVCPVHNYETQGSPWGNIAGSGWCRIQKGVFKAVLDALSTGAGRRVIGGWLKEREHA